MKRIGITYEIPPLRAMYLHKMKEESKETAIKRFKEIHPYYKIHEVRVLK